jgi:hypothetical protein
METRNLIQMITDTQNHIRMMREDSKVSREDILDDLENRLVQVFHRVVTTPTVTNFVLPIDEFDHNDVFLRADTAIASEI